LLVDSTGLLSEWLVVNVHVVGQPALFAPGAEVVGTGSFDNF
jgi:hypothetical protein